MKKPTDFRVKIEHILLVMLQNREERIKGEPVSEILSAVSELIKECIGEEPSGKWKGKIRCDCPCPGPFCNSLAHPCKKPKEHYLQSDQAIVEIRQQQHAEIRQRFKEKLGT